MLCLRTRLTGNGGKPQLARRAQWNPSRNALPVDHDARLGAAQADACPIILPLDCTPKPDVSGSGTLTILWDGPRTQTDRTDGLEAQVAGQRIGYVRVSTLDQNEKRQLDGLILDREFTDKASGRLTSGPQLAELLGFAREGDTVVMHSMDRLAWNLENLQALARRMTCKGVRVEFVKEQLVFTAEDSPIANLMLTVYVPQGVEISGGHEEICAWPCA